MVGSRTAGDGETHPPCDFLQLIGLSFCQFLAGVNNQPLTEFSGFQLLSLEGNTALLGTTSSRIQSAVHSCEVMHEDALLRGSHAACTPRASPSALVLLTTQTQPPVARRSTYASCLVFGRGCDEGAYRHNPVSCIWPNQMTWTRMPPSIQASNAGTCQVVGEDHRDATLSKVYASRVLVGGSTRNLAATEQPLGSPHPLAISSAESPFPKTPGRNNHVSRVGLLAASL